MSSFGSSYHRRRRIKPHAFDSSRIEGLSNSNLMTYNQKIREIDEKIQNDYTIILNKLKTMEQLQANILDKLTIFAEMIDNIQKKIEAAPNLKCDENVY